MTRSSPTAAISSCSRPSDRETAGRRGSPWRCRRETPRGGRSEGASRPPVEPPYGHHVRRGPPAVKKTVAAANPDAYVAALTGWRRTLVEALRSAVRSAARIDEVIKWGDPGYPRHGPRLGDRGR